MPPGMSGAAWMAKLTIRSPKEQIRCQWQRRRIFSHEVIAGRGSARLGQSQQSYAIRAVIFEREKEPPGLGNRTACAGLFGPPFDNLEPGMKPNRSIPASAVIPSMLYVFAP